MFNPQNPSAATVMSLAEVGKYVFMFHTVLNCAFFARGYLEECLGREPDGVGYGLSGVLKDGFRWAGGDMTLITCCSSKAFPYRDGVPASVCSPNPAPDMGEAELGEFLQPTQLNIGRKLVPNYCGHGKFRGGLGIGMCQMIVDPGQSLTIAVFASSGSMGRAATGMSGGYPGINDVVVFAHDTNMRELLKEGKPYPRDFLEVRKWLAEGRLKAGSVEVYNTATPNIPCKDGDLFASASTAMGGWGDPLERDFSLVESDVHYGWMTLDAARTIYGAVMDEKGKVKVAESDQLRQQKRKRRKERSVDAREWWREERQQVIRKEFPEDVYNMYADCLKYGKFRREFMGMWQLPEDYKL
jgi:N-methylhydantoinase B/acetone carboxylase alpha subunit